MATAPPYAELSSPRIIFLLPTASKPPGADGKILLSSLHGHVHSFAFVPKFTLRLDLTFSSWVSFPLSASLNFWDQPWLHCTISSACTRSLTMLSSNAGSLKERQVYKKALKLLGVRIPGKRSKIPRPRRRFSRAQPAQTPSISGKLLLDASPVIGQDILLTLTLKNLISDFKNIKVKLKASAILYTRKPKAEILQLHRSIKLGSEEGNFDFITTIITGHT